MDFCVQCLALNFFFIDVQTGEKAGFFLHVRCLRSLYFYFVFSFFNFFIMSQIGLTLRSTLFGLLMKCTNVQLLKSEIKINVSECLMRIMSIFSQYCFSYFYSWVVVFFFLSR